MESPSEPQSPSWDQEIPPAVACARCGLASCDGCEAAPTQAVDGDPSCVPWEQAATFSNLVASAFMSSDSFDRMFPAGRTHRGWDAFVFAVLAESLAIASFAVPWALGFILLFPRLSGHMVESPLVWGFASLVMVVLVTLVVGIHVIWGLALEWQVAQGMGVGTPQYGLGIRFGLYACGWDLVTSPAGAVLAWMRFGHRRMLPRLRQAAAAPRASLRYYTQTLRKLNAAQAKRAIFRSFFITSAAFFLCLVAVLGVLVWSMLRGAI